MRLELIKPSTSLNKAFRKTSLKRDQVELFKTNLKRLFDRINEQESEEHCKNIVSDFLKDTWYRNLYEINTKGRADLVIHNGKSSSDTAGVIFEVKRPVNKSEMISVEKPNEKAFHELLNYYLEERYINNNKEIKHLIITNIYEWYIFEGSDFERFFFDNQKLTQHFKDWHDGLFGVKLNEWFYQEIAKPFIEKELTGMKCTHFDLRSFETIIKNEDKADDTKLIDLYKTLSPEHLLKKSFANDSNTLNKEFYNELLHIIGLEERKETGKKVIKRKSAETRNEGSLLENTINVLKIRNKLLASDNLEQFGNTKEDQLFSIGLELCLTWLNRILFLKLLEGQLVRYHQGNKDFEFLNCSRVKDFDELNELFFEVLAIPYDYRTSSVTEKFGNLPYLNSSLFEESELEQKTIVITELKGRLEIPIHPSTVLKDSRGKMISGKRNTLQYLFEFLNAFDFASDNTAEIQEQNKTLINASVLGLIFEKINGYKDGSFFTPGFITMYMCRETIRRAVIQKFNEKYSWECDDLTVLYNKLEKISLKEANDTINSIKICDPAVGSGHFLVSALNEIISIKNDLAILIDSEGKRLKGYSVTIENDELILTHEDEIFFYNYRDKESQRIQKTLFHEKQTIIENCLFGVDINPKSVMICRLRLWIELLKNAYYTSGSKFTELETLPNIDINIKCGNSLISRYSLDADIKKALEKSKWTIESYRLAIMTYRNARNKEEKREMEQLIEKIKNDFVSEISANDKRLLLLNKLNGELFTLSNQTILFERSKKEKEEWNKKVKELTIRIKKLESEIEEIKNNKIYKNAFEWRFEFPEVLNDEGDFVGFDVVIGNPPYIPLEAFTEKEKQLFKNKFTQFERKYETSVMFMIEGFGLLNKTGMLSYIAPITWQTGENYSNFRKFLIFNKGINQIVNLPFNTFEDAYVDTGLYFFMSKPTSSYSICNFNKKIIISDLTNVHFQNIISSTLIPPKYKIILDEKTSSFLSKFCNGKYTLLGIITKSTQGLSGSRFQRVEDNISDKFIFPYLSKGNIYNYCLLKDEIFKISLAHNKSLLQFYLAEPKILIRRIINRQNRLSVTCCEEKLVFKKDINPFVLTDSRFSMFYLQGVLASKFISYLYVNQSSIATKDDFRQTTLAELRKLPIPIISEVNQKGIIDKVTKIITLKKSDSNANTSALETEIDRMVYDLYGLTEEEIGVVEGK